MWLGPYPMPLRVNQLLSRASAAKCHASKPRLSVRETLDLRDADALRDLALRELVVEAQQYDLALGEARGR